MTTARIPLILGNSIGVLGIALALYLIVAAADISNSLVAFVVYAVSWACLEFFPHCLAHYIVGRLVGVRFTHYEIGKSSIKNIGLPVISWVASALPLLTLRIDRRSLRSVSHSARAVTFASGATVSMILPLFAVVVSFRHLPLGLSLVLLLISVSNLGLDLYYSPKAGDISRIR